jgi:hypothetical protein
LAYASTPRVPRRRRTPSSQLLRVQRDAWRFEPQPLGRVLEQRYSCARAGLEHLRGRTWGRGMDGSSTWDVGVADRRIDKYRARRIDRFVDDAIGEQHCTWPQLSL